MINQSKIMRRVAGYHDIRLDGITDLLLRARGMSVLDVGCNRGLVGFEFANNGARLVHGCDNFVDGIKTAKEIFADLRNVENKFEVVDLKEGNSALAPLGHGTYDTILLLAIVHKIARIMSKDDLYLFMRQLAQRSLKYIGWRSTAADKDSNDRERDMLSAAFGETGMKLVQYSEISELGPAGIWSRV